jgi:hypothetical protein
MSANRSRIAKAAVSRTALGHQVHDRSLFPQRRDIFANVEFGIDPSSGGASANNGRNWDKP